MKRVFLILTLGGAAACLLCMGTMSSVQYFSLIGVGENCIFHLDYDGMSRARHT